MDRSTDHVRLRSERTEEQVLAPWATPASASRGRERDEPQCHLRTVFQRDRDRILHTKAFRRLKHKTQVFLAPEGDHYRTRLTHTLEVAQVARTICRSLRLNEDLVEAIALGHDLGHTPFGHVGEEALGQAMSRPFEHNRQSVRVVDVLERDGAGLNLTAEVLDGILNHRWTMPEPATAEGVVARWADRIAYVNHDVDDAIRAGILRATDLPETSTRILGAGYGQRLDTMVTAMVAASEESGGIVMPELVAEAMLELRNFLFERVYHGPARTEPAEAREIVTGLCRHFQSEPPPGLGGPDQRVIDYVSGMTDRFAATTFRELST